MIIIGINLTFWETKTLDINVFLFVQLCHLY